MHGTYEDVSTCTEPKTLLSRSSSVFLAFTVGTALSRSRRGASPTLFNPVELRQQPLPASNLHYPSICPHAGRIRDIVVATLSFAVSSYIASMSIAVEFTAQRADPLELSNSWQQHLGSIRVKHR